ncbi:MAG: HAD family hydrolase [Acidimicrobiales bacterium]
MSVSAVVFDMDGVCCRYNLDRRLQILSGWSGREPEDIYQSIWASGFEAAAEVGLVSAEEYLAGFGQRMGYPITRAQWAEARRLALSPNEAVLASAGSLSSRYRVAMLTNNGFLLKELLSEVCPDVVAVFGDKAVFSAELGAKKPDPEAFRRLSVRLGVEPAEIAYIDDDRAYVDGARAAGLSAAWLADPAHIGEVLADLGIDGATTAVRRSRRARESQGG